MTNLLFYNDASTTIGATVSPSDTSITLASGAGTLFSPGPTGSQYFLATLRDQATGLLTEIVKVTSISGDIVTVVRAQEGTTARSWTTGDSFANQCTAGTMQTLATEAAPTADKWTTARTITLGGDASGSVSIDGSANVTLNTTNAKAAKWTTARTITLGGDASGSVSIDGSANVTLNVTNSQAAKLTTARSITMTGDVAWGVSFDGSAAVTASGTLSNTAVTSGSYTNTALTVDAKGRITAASSGAAPLLVSNNLSDISGNTNKAAARTNLQITSYDSPSFAPSGGIHSYAHGLSSIPAQKWAALILTCTSADQGYSVGDQIIYNNLYNTGFSGARGYTIAIDTTNILCIIDTNPGAFVVEAKTGGAAVLDQTKWNAQMQILFVGV